jgi:hypothetical protein
VALHKLKRQIGRIGETMFSVSNDLAILDALENRPFQLVTQFTHSSVLFGQACERQISGRPETHDSRHVLRSRPTPLLLPASLQQWMHAHATPNVDRPDPLWTVKLMARKREHIDVAGPYIDRYPANRLHRIGVKYRARSMGEIGEHLDGGQIAGFVVG